MLSVANKPILLSVVKLSVIMLNAIMLSVVAPATGDLCHKFLPTDFRGIIAPRHFSPSLIFAIRLENS